MLLLIPRQLIVNNRGVNWKFNTAVNVKPIICKNMKNNSIMALMLQGVLFKNLLTMKLLVLCFILSVLNVSGSVYSQNAEFALNYKNIRVSELLQEIEKRSDYKFLYRTDLIDMHRLISLNVADIEVEELLEMIFPNEEASFRIFEGNLVAITSNSEFKLQQLSVSGTVTDASTGEPIPGVTILLKGTTIGTATNTDGFYSLSGVPGDGTLVFSFVGLITQEIYVDDRNSIDVTMEYDAIGIDEVVSIGYGTARRSDLTGSVSRVNVDDLAELPNVSIMQAVQGVIPGLNVGVATRAGDAPSFTVRGFNTLSTGSADNAPLIVVDGIIYRGSIMDLNTSDIESIDVLKDASSAAIYGSQSSNGVILITTKKGEVSDKPMIQFSSSYTLKNPRDRNMRPMRAGEYEDFYTDVWWALGARQEPDYLTPTPDWNVTNRLGSIQEVTGYNRGYDTDWWGLFTRQSALRSHNLSLSGSGEMVSYYMSIGATDETGYFKGEDYSRYNFRLNMDAQVTSWFDIGMESFLTSSDYSGPAVSVGDVFGRKPWAYPFEEDGTRVYKVDAQVFNPYHTFDRTHSDKRLNLFGTLWANIELPFGINYRVNYSQNSRTRNLDFYDPWGYGNHYDYIGYAYKNRYSNYDWTLDNILSTNRTINDIHNFNATLVYGVEKIDYDFTGAESSNYDNHLLGYNRLQAGSIEQNRVSSNAEQEASLYMMGRLLYSLNDRYMLTGTVRRDGFSGFGADEKIGIFPSLALAWVISEENFLIDTEWLDYFKLRTSYGVTGRRGVGRYDTQARVDYAPVYVFGDGGSPQFGQNVTSMSNIQLGWEKTTGVNTGFDFGVGKIFSGSIDYYNNNTENILYPIQLPLLTGFSSINTNIGKVHNYGLELDLHSRIINRQALTWSASFVFSRNRNEIISILGKQNGVEQDLVANRLFIGEPQNVIYDYEIIGMWQLEDQEAGIIPNGFYPGTYKISGGTEDGTFSASEDMKILGYQDPSYRFGIGNTVTYNNFRLYVFINSIQGGRDYYYGAQTRQSTNADQLFRSNVAQGGWDYWVPENPDAFYRRLDVGASYDPYRYLQRSFIRLQDVSLSYTFNRDLISNIGFNHVRVYLSGKNLLTFTNWEGWDPETGQGIGSGRPVMRDFTLGLNVTF